MKLSKKLFSDTSLLSSALMIWVLVSCLIPNVWLSFTEPLSPLQAIANVLLPAGVYMLLMSWSAKIGRTSLWMIIIMFFAASQIVLLYMYGRSVIAVDMFLNVVTTNPGEVGELLGNLLIIIAAIVILYIPPIVAGIAAVYGRWRLGTRTLRITHRMAWCTFAIGIIAFILSFFSPRPYHPVKDLYPINVFYNVYLAVDRTVKVSHYHQTSAPYTFHATPTHPDSIPELYVVVIGETARAANWQLLGYDRSTTPRLMNRDGLVGYDRAISQSNTTHKSVPMLMSALDAETFGDSIYSVKSFITAFKESGFHTAFLSNQSRNHSFIDFFGEEADTCLFIKEQEPSSSPDAGFDAALLPYIDTMRQSGHHKILVVLHTYGSHFSYIDRYPRSSAAFTPDSPVDATPSLRPNLINAYDNTIHYTSSLLADIMDRLETYPGLSALIYTSDHGEDIFDDSRHLFLHASPIPSYYQIHVPYLVWMSPGYRTLYPHKTEAAQANAHKFVASSRSFFHTIMDIAGISTPVFDAASSTVHADYAPQRPIYLNDHNESISLESCGILKPDIEKLASLGILSIY